MNEYEKQAQEFLDWTGAKVLVEFTGIRKHFDSDTVERPCFKVTIQKGRNYMTVNYGSSIASLEKARKPKLGGERYEVNSSTVSRRFNSGEFNPTPYDVLACITKDNPGTFSDFCSDFGYSEDSQSSYKTYKAVVQEWLKISSIFTSEELEKLREIN